MIGHRWQDDVAWRRRAVVARRQDQILAALAFVRSGRTDVCQRRLPGIHDGAGDGAVTCRRDLQHHRADILGVEERLQIDHVRVRRERLDLPVRQARPVHDLVGLALGAANHRLKHQVEIDRGHVPVDCLDCTPFDGAAGELLGREILRLDSYCRAHCCAGKAECCNDYLVHRLSSSGSLCSNCLRVSALRRYATLLYAPDLKKCAVTRREM